MALCAAVTCAAAPVGDQTVARSSAADATTARSAGPTGTPAPGTPGAPPAARVPAASSPALAASPPAPATSPPAPPAPAAKDAAGAEGDAAGATGDQAPVDQGPALGDFGRSVVGGAATLSGLAGCKPTPTPPGALDPLLVAYRLEGELLERAAEVRAVIDAALTKSKIGLLWSESTCHGLRAVLGDLHYHIRLSEMPVQDGVLVTINAKPYTLIRHVHVTGNWPLFEEEIKRRLRLRPGGMLEEDPSRRKAQLEEEEVRIREFLWRQGYFDARVRIEVRAEEAPHEASLAVHLRKGPGYEVGRLRVSGNAAARDEVILQTFRDKEWFGNCGLLKSCFTSDRLKQDLDEVRALYQTKYGYPGARIRTTFSPAQSPDRRSKTVRFGVEIVERKKIDAAFDGNARLPEESLREVLTFGAEGAYDDFEAAASAEAIRKLYQSRGYFQAIVGFERFRLLPTYERILFHIDEGPQFRVVDVSFRGNQRFVDERLRGVIATREFPRFHGLFSSGGYVTSLQLQQDVDALVAFYQANGFPHVKVTAHVATDPKLYDDVGALAAVVSTAQRGRGLFIRYDVKEGEQDVVTAVDFVNNDHLPDERLAAITRLRPGVPFTQGAMEDDKRALLRLYQSHGYLHAEVRARRKGRGRGVRVIYDVVERELARFGKVLIRGNFKTADWVIRDALGYREREVMTLDRLEAGQQRLRATDLFSSVRPPVRVGRDPVNLIVDVEERYDNRGNAEVGVGFSTDNNLFVSGLLAFRNIGGVGASLVMNGEAGLEKKRVLATLGLPLWVMKRFTKVPLKLDLSGKYLVDDTQRFGQLTTRGFSAGLSRQLSPSVYLSVKYDYNNFGRSTELTRPAGSNQDLKRVTVPTTTASVGPALIVDRRRPSPLAPTSGWFLSGAFAYASRYLLGSDDFLKLSLAGQLFVPIGKRVVISNAVRYDHGFPLGGAVVLPEVERFVAGGDTTVRGFEEDHLHTEIIRDPLQPGMGVHQFRVVPAGGNIRFIHNLEAQVNVWDKSFLFDMPIASAVFLDTGLVTNSFDRFRIGKLRHSLGIAFARVVTPVGSVSFEYAIPLDPQLGDDPTGRFHFNFGFVF